MLMLGHKNMQAYFCDTRYRMFHVKPYEASEAGTNIFVPISEPIKVGHAVSKNSQGFQAKRHLCIFIWKPQGVGL